MSDVRPEGMTFPRMDNVAIVVDDLPLAIAFFTALGLELGGQAKIEGPWADKVVGIKGLRSEIAMMKTPDGHSQLELTKYHHPQALSTEPKVLPPNTLGLHRVMFEVEDIDGTLARLSKHGAKVIDEVVNYEGIYRLCYLRGPGGIIVALAEKIG